MSEPKKPGKAVAKNPKKRNVKGPPSMVSTQELIQAFRLTAQYNGNAAKAARELGINPDTLRVWRRRNNELYLKVSKEEIETIRQAEAEKHLSVAAEARDLESEVIQKIKQAIAEDAISPRDLANVSRNLATESGIHTDKALALLGEAQAGIQVNINLPEMVRSWASKGSKFYDAEGNVIPPEKVIEAEAVPEDG